MSKVKFSSNTITKLKNNPNVTYISEKQINFTVDFKVKIAQCNTINELRKLFKENNISIESLGSNRIESLYDRLKRSYRKNGVAAFTSEKRGRKEKSIIDNKTYIESETEQKLKIAEQKLKEQQEEIDMLKKFMPFLPKQCKKSNKFIAIKKFVECNTYKELTKTQTIEMLCKYLNVSRSGYYKFHCTKVQTTKQSQDNLISELIIEIQNVKFRKSKTKHKRIGYRQMTMQINERLDYRVNSKRVLRLMRLLNLQSTFRRKNPYKIMPIKDQEHKTFENILDRNFDAPIPGSVICTDITYLIGRKFKAYLSVMKDATTGKILSHVVSTNLKMDLVLNTVDKLPEELLHDETIIQSDQGFHYTNPQYIRKLQLLNIEQSMSRKGKCIDNSPVESFFGHFKDEVAYEDAETIDELEDIINEYMLYYNYQRPQLHKEKMTPHQRECHLL